MQKILYLMHVPWGWIKQRPHFVAEYLAEDFNVTVVLRKTYRSGKLVTNSAVSKVNFKQLFVLPGKRFDFVSRINNLLVKYQLRHCIANYDCVWITHPELFESVREILPQNIKLIYDCMDDALEFPLVSSNKSIRTHLANIESLLVERSNVIFTSSENLRLKLFQRYARHENIHVVNNGICLPEDSSENNDLMLLEADNIIDSITTKKIIYIGTISEWFDFDLLLRSLSEFSNITYVLVGPTEVPIPEHKQIVHVPPIEHRFIFKFMDKADALVMPFKVNELVLSVNPVKVYEYIYSGKPSIVTSYCETEKFKDLVYLYASPIEFCDSLERALYVDNPNKISDSERMAFGRNNTWRSRVNTMLDKL